jgi:hypothetical protein
MTTDLYLLSTLTMRGAIPANIPRGVEIYAEGYLNITKFTARSVLYGPLSYEPWTSGCTYLIQRVVNSEQHAYRYLGLYGADSSNYDVIKTGVIPSLRQGLAEM